MNLAFILTINNNDINSQNLTSSERCEKWHLARRKYSWPKPNLFFVVSSVNGENKFKTRKHYEKQPGVEGKYISMVLPQIF